MSKRRVPPCTVSWSATVNLTCGHEDLVHALGTRRLICSGFDSMAEELQSRATCAHTGPVKATVIGLF